MIAIVLFINLVNLFNQAKRVSCALHLPCLQHFELTLEDHILNRIGIKQWQRGKLLPAYVVYNDLPTVLIYELGRTSEGQKIVHVDTDLLFLNQFFVLFQSGPALNDSRVLLADGLGLWGYGFQQ